MIAKSALAASGGPILVSVALSGYCSGPGEPLGATLALNDVPVVEPTLYAKPGMNHLALLPMQEMVKGPSSPATLSLVADKLTWTDMNDRCSVSALQLGENPQPGYVRLLEHGSVPPSGQIPSYPFETYGGVVLVSVAATGSTNAAPKTVGMSIAIDGNPIGSSQLFANQPEVSQVFVPAHVVLPKLAAREHRLELSANAGTEMSPRDAYCMTVLEIYCPASVINLTEVLANATCRSQLGGKLIVDERPFTSAGGQLLVRVGASAWSASPPNTLLGIGIQIDGTPYGSLQLDANQPQMHLCLVPNDLVVTDLPSGNHKLALMAEANTVTDANDRCSVTIIEVANAPR